VIGTDERSVLQRKIDGSSDLSSCGLRIFPLFPHQLRGIFDGGV
jgi:hypothetical protein